MVVGDLVPDLTLLLRIDPARAFYRQTEIDDRFESAGADFQAAVARAYDELAERNPERIVVIDAEGNPDGVHERIIEIVNSRAPND